MAAAQLLMKARGLLFLVFAWWLPMSNVIRSVREVAPLRRKHGQRETRQELLARLAEARALKERKRELAQTVCEANPNAFFYAFHSVSRDCVRHEKKTVEELNRKRKYVLSEIKRCEMKTKETRGTRTHIYFAEDGNVAERITEEQEVSLEEAARICEYKEYVEELKEKLVAIDDMIRSVGDESGKKKR